MSSFTQDNGYERKVLTNNGPSIEDRWHGPFADVWAQTEYKIGKPCPYDPLMVLNKITLSKDQASFRGYIDLMYSGMDSSTPPVDTGKNVYTLTSGPLEKAIETHTNYKKCWNNYLAMANGKETPAWWDTDDNDASIPDITQFQWVKDLGSVDTQSIGKKWTYLNKKKPGVESYIVASPVVEATLYFSQATRAYQIAVKNGKRAAPAVTFGITGGEWLVNDCSLSQQGKKWVATVRYQWADSWDHDIYEAG